MIYTTGGFIESAEDRIARHIGVGLRVGLLLAWAAMCWLRPDVIARVSAVFS